MTWLYPLLRTEAETSREQRGAPRRSRVNVSAHPLRMVTRSAYRKH